MCIPGSLLLFSAKMVEIDVAEVGTKNNEMCFLPPNYLLSNYLHLLYLFTLCWHTGDNVRLSDVVKFCVWSFGSVVCRKGEGGHNRSPPVTCLMQFVYICVNS